MAEKLSKRKLKSQIKLVLTVICLLLFVLFWLLDYFGIVSYRGISQAVGLYDNTIAENLSGTVVHFIDVDQGQCILISSGNQYMLIDAGEKEYSSKVVSYLNSLGVEKLDYVIATHPHSDHIGALSDIIKTFHVDTIIAPVIPDELVPTSDSYYNFLNAVKNNGKGLTKAVAGESYSLGDAVFTIVAPIKSVSDDLNNYSVVCVLRYGNNTALFGGDASKDEENDILESGADIDVDLLNVAHHGSSSSSTEKYLSAVSPEYCVIMCGADNPYGHPNSSTIERLGLFTDNIYRTDFQGTIVCEMDGNGGYRFFSEKENKL